MNTSSIRVLIVDDEPAVGRSLAEYLRDYDFDVSLADNAEAALRLLAESVHDVAIVDLRLPRTNSEELILKAHEISPQTRFVIYMGSANYQIPERLGQIGIQPEHVFVKPQPDLERLVQTLRTLTRKA